MSKIPAMKRTQPDAMAHRDAEAATFAYLRPRQGMFASYGEAMTAVLMALHTTHSSHTVALTANVLLTGWEREGWVEATTGRALLYYTA